VLLRQQVLSPVANHEQRRFLEQPEEFEDDHDNDNHSNDVKDVSVMAATHIRVCGGKHYPE
jgi:hypothetical protein